MPDDCRQSPLFHFSLKRLLVCFTALAIGSPVVVWIGREAVRTEGRPTLLGLLVEILFLSTAFLVFGPLIGAVLHRGFSRRAVATGMAVAAVASLIVAGFLGLLWVAL
jgi:hypothetical protein